MAPAVLSRRACLTCLAASLVGFRAPSARAVRGAAELDAEYYLRSSLGLSAPSVASRTPKPPRTLDASTANVLLTAVTAQVAATVGESPESITATAVAQGPRLAIELDRALSSGLFSDGGYSMTNSLASTPLTNEFAFDLRLFALYSLIANGKIRREADRVTFINDLGDRLLSSMPSVIVPSTLNTSSIQSAAAGCRRLLEHLREVGYITAFQFDSEDADDALWAERSDLSTTLLRATLEEPAALRSALLLSQRAGGVSSDLAAPMLASYLRRACDADVLVSQYFVDEYRDNPRDYRPSQLIIEMTLIPSSLGTQ